MRYILRLSESESYSLPGYYEVEAPNVEEAWRSVKHNYLTGAQLNRVVRVDFATLDDFREFKKR
jgi:hypothetical protein